jgi:hypothetical protein
MRLVIGGWPSSRRLGRLAALLAAGAASPELCAAPAEEVGRVLKLSLVEYLRVLAPSLPRFAGQPGVPARRPRLAGRGAPARLEPATCGRRPVDGVRRRERCRRPCLSGASVGQDDGDLFALGERRQEHVVQLR